MIFSVIDLGTNTFNLLIAESNTDNTYTKLFNTKIAVKLGEGGINKGIIDAIPFERGINALIVFEKEIKNYKAETNFAFATSAIRSASNGLDFVKIAKEKTGIEITIIDGNEEAELIYFGNKMAVQMTDAMSLIMDIGGGSNEFILANQSTIFWKQSFLLGAARLLDMFKPSNPITQNEITEFNDYLFLQMQPLLDAVKKHPPTELIGSSGAFDSVIDIIDGIYNTGICNDLNTEYSIDIEKYKVASKEIIASTLEQRKNRKGLIEMRMDMIVISFLLIDFIVHHVGITKIRVSTFSLKEGVIFKKLGLHTKH